MRKIKMKVGVYVFMFILLFLILLILIVNLTHAQVLEDIEDKKDDLIKIIEQENKKTKKQ